MQHEIGFDAVVFDLDGTLVATDRFWLDAAARGADRAFAALGLERPLPTPEQWMSLVGSRIEDGFRTLFPDLDPDQRRTVLEACVEEEVAMLEGGAAPSMPEAREVLERLRARGVKLAIASNCQQSYLDRMLEALDLSSLIQGAYCAESPGMTSKALMIARLLRDLGTRSAVMVGDRASDRDAAWSNGLPHVHCAFGFAQGQEDVEAEGCIGGLPELLPLLARRTQWLDSILARMDALLPGAVLAVSGQARVGKTLFARDLARRVRAHGLEAAALSLDDYRVGGAGSELDRERLQAEVLRPHAAGEELALVLPDLEGRLHVRAGAVLLLEGEDAVPPEGGPGPVRHVHLTASEAVLDRRRRALGLRRPAPGAPGEARDTLVGPPPEGEGRVLLDVSNVLGERPQSPRPRAAGLGAHRSPR